MGLELSIDEFCLVFVLVVVFAWGVNLAQTAFAPSFSINQARLPKLIP